MNALNNVQSHILYLAMATADRGDLDTAEQTIAEMHRHTGPTAGSLDLLARIQILRGNREEAKRLWKEAYNLDSTGEDSKNALQCLQGIGKGPLWLHTPAFKVLATVAILAFLAAILAAWRLLGPSPVTVRVPPPPSTQALAEPPQQLQSAARAEHHVALSKADLRLPAIEGCTALETPEGVVLVFPNGLFRQGEELLPGARKTLMEVAKNLSAHPGRIQVLVKGTTDARTPRKDSPFKNNTLLALHRAALIAEELRREGSFAMGAIVVTSTLPVSATKTIEPKALHSNQRSVEILIRRLNPSEEGAN
jgi:flagellar motor protein MotB